MKGRFPHKPITRALRALRGFLVPPAESEPEFRAEIHSLSRVGLATLGTIEVCIPVPTFVLHRLVHNDAAVQGGALVMTVVLACVGLLTFLLARVRWGHNRARALAIASGLCSAAVWIASSAAVPEFRATGDYIPAGLTVIMLTLVAAVPLRPVHSLSLGLAIEGMYLASGGSTTS